MRQGNFLGQREKAAMTSREQFEAAFPVPEHVRWDGEQYLCDSRHQIRAFLTYYEQWDVWQASRKALEIVLPDDGIADCERDWGARCKDTFDCGYNYASVQHEKAIEAAGIRTTP